ncbi:hypothetical protein [Candidatus Odyssella thessalonicensis]|uniref:hypothetical protein n=1 Tax=Candidatus Odyssella thessalonicensis TaxID=84647 RepID=UPI000225B4FC|nr:hypothetical protein [Candidatus Odyssella thessalonicensis]
MKKITHTFSILSTSIIGLALSATLVTANDYLSRADAQRYQIAQETEKSSEENERYYEGLNNKNSQLLMQIYKKAALIAKRDAKGEDYYYSPPFGRTEKEHPDLKEYKEFKDDLKKDSGKSQDFDKLVKYVEDNFDCLYKLYEEKNFAKLASFRTTTVSFGEPYVPGGNGRYRINIISLSSTQQ